MDNIIDLIKSCLNELKIGEKWYKLKLTTSSSDSGTTGYITFIIEE